MWRRRGQAQAGEPRGWWSGEQKQESCVCLLTSYRTSSSILLSNNPPCPPLPRPVSSLVSLLLERACCAPCLCCTSPPLSGLCPTHALKLIPFRGSQEPTIVTSKRWKPIPVSLCLWNFWCLSSCWRISSQPWRPGALYPSLSPIPLRRASPLLPPKASSLPDLGSLSHVLHLGCNSIPVAAKPLDCSSQLGPIFRRP